MISHGGTSTVGTKHLVFRPSLQVSDTAYETLVMTSWDEAGKLQMFDLTNACRILIKKLNQPKCPKTPSHNIQDIGIHLDSTGKLSVVWPSRLSLNSVLGHTQSRTVLSIRRLMRGLHSSTHRYCSSSLFETVMLTNWLTWHLSG